MKVLIVDKEFHRFEGTSSRNFGREKQCVLIQVNKNKIKDKFRLAKSPGHCLKLCWILKKILLTCISIPEDLSTPKPFL